MPPVAIPIILGITAAVTAGASIYEATNQPTTPKAPTPAESAAQQAQASQAAALAQANALTKRRGMASTILTSPQGESGTPATQHATLGA